MSCQATHEHCLPRESVPTPWRLLGVGALCANKFLLSLMYRMEADGGDSSRSRRRHIMAPIRSLHSAFVATVRTRPWRCQLLLDLSGPRSRPG